MPIDDSLLEACKAKKRIAQRQLYDLLLPYLRAVAKRYLKNDSYTKDALQESFVKLFTKIDTFDPKKAAIKSWAARIVINTCLNYNQRIIGKPTEEFITERHENFVEAEALKKATDEELLAIIKQMPKGYFEIFNLYVIDGYKHQEIAEILNISVELSRKKLSRAKSWLRASRNNAASF